MKRIHYGWFICLGCALLLFCTSGLSINTFTVFQPYILSENGFTNTQTSSIITIRSLFSFISMFLTGIYYKKISLRNGMFMAGLINAFGFFLFGIADNYPLYCAGAVCIGIGYGFGTMVPIALLLERWFIKKRTLALSICSAITGLSTFGFPSLLTWLIETFSLKTTFIGESLFIVLLSYISFLLIRDDPFKKGVLPYGAHANLSKDSQHASSSTVLTKKYWALLVPMLLFLGAMTSVAYSHLAVLTSSEGYGSQTVALSITISGVSLTISKCIFGLIADKISTYKCNIIFSFVLTIGIVLCCLVGTHKIILFAAMCLYGIGLAFTTVGLTAWAGDFSNGQEYDKTVRRFQLGYTAGGLLFSSLPGILADRFNGSYIPAYVFFVVCTLFVIFSVQFVYKKCVVHPKLQS